MKSSTFLSLKVRGRFWKPFVYISVSLLHLVVYIIRCCRRQQAKGDIRVHEGERPLQISFARPTRAFRVLSFSDHHFRLRFGLSLFLVSRCVIRPADVFSGHQNVFEFNIGGKLFHFAANNSDERMRFMTVMVQNGALTSSSMSQKEIDMSAEELSVLPKEFLYKLVRKMAGSMRCEGSANDKLPGG